MFKQLLYSGPPFTILHEAYAKHGRIDDQAAIKASDEIFINTGIQAVWEILEDLPSWPTFNPLISDVKLESNIVVDAKGSLKLKGFPVKITFAIVDPGRELTWTGVSLWTRAIDRFVLEPISNNKTRLRLEESLAGVFVPLMSSSTILHQQHQESLSSIKKAVETSR